MKKEEMIFALKDAKQKLRLCIDDTLKVFEELDAKLLENCFKEYETYCKDYSNNAPLLPIIRAFESQVQHGSAHVLPWFDGWHKHGKSFP